jgi:hypothetical protein
METPTRKVDTMSRTIRYGSEYTAQTHKRGCKIRRTFNTLSAAYPEMSEANIVRMVARRTGNRIETVQAAL